ncbi:MAG: SusE domain-containing protein [Marinifilaceae bacterium]
MKKINILFAILGMFALFSCSEEDKDPVVGNFVAPTLQNPTSGGKYILSKEIANNNFQTYIWTAADYGFPTSVTYTLQIDVEDNNFANAVEVDHTNSLYLPVKVSTVNEALIKRELKPGEEVRVEARIRATLHSNLDTLYSEVITYTLTPYLSEKAPLFLVGQHNGWDNSTAPEMNKQLDGDKYEIFINMPAVDQGFKLLPQRGKWDGDMGNDPANSGNLIADGEENMTVAAAGYYLIEVDLEAMTWSSTQTSWGVIGSATADHWDSDQDMTYDAETNTWSVTLDLAADGDNGREIKFRANDDWGINFGDSGADGSLERGGDNIKVPSDGNYTITLKLGYAGNYTYTLTKN